MADTELDLDLDLEEEPSINKTEERIKNLSSKVRDAAKERDEAKAAAEASDAARLAAEKKAEFLESFSDVATKYPGASEFKTQIEERTQKGYSIEDAAVAALAEAGRFAPQQHQTVAPATAGTMGGSAPVSITGDSRPYSDMSREEKRAALLEADARGELRQILEQR
jgi:predicted NBD/HSP70 family sugar kinase